MTQLENQIRNLEEEYKEITKPKKYFMPENRIAIICRNGSPFVSLVWNKPWVVEHILDWYSEKFAFKRDQLSLLIQAPMALIEHEETM